MPDRSRPTEALIYIPAPDSDRLRIDPGSGIVGTSALSEDQILLYFEGNRYDVENLRRYEQRIKQAAGRLFQRYPTIARMNLPADEVARNLVVVGRINDKYEIDWDNRSAAFAYGEP